DYGLSTSAVFSDPPLGVTGMGEEDARRTYGDDVMVYHSRFVPMKYALEKPDDKPTSYCKLIVHAETMSVLGCHMVGDDAPEIIQGFAAAIDAGATKEDFDNTLAIHPSSAEEFVLMR